MNSIIVHIRYICTCGASTTIYVHVVDNHLTITCILKDDGLFGEIGRARVGGCGIGNPAMLKLFC